MRSSSRRGRADIGRARWRSPSQVTNMQKSMDFTSSQTVSMASSADMRSSGIAGSSLAVAGATRERERGFPGTARRAQSPPRMRLLRAVLL